MKNLGRPVMATIMEWVDNPVFDENATFSNHKQVTHPYIDGKKVSNRSSKVQKPVEYIGTFHTWGVDCDIDGDGIDYYTKAVIELNNGKVMCVNADELRFLDK